LRYTVVGRLAGVSRQHDHWTMFRLAYMGHIQCESKPCW
jgi:hypothetical protein